MENHCIMNEEDINTDKINAQVSDSAYSTSCSNSQSRRSHSTKSTHSGSNSSGSSGYRGGQASTSGSSNNALAEHQDKRSKDKDAKKKKPASAQPDEESAAPEPEVAEVVIEPAAPPPVTEPPIEEPLPQDVVPAPTSPDSKAEKAHEGMEICLSEEVIFEMNSCSLPRLSNSSNVVNTKASPVVCHDGFACVMAMNDGIVMFTSSSLTKALGYPNKMWLGRSFIDFIHPNDRNTFASQITNNLSVPTSTSSIEEKDPITGTQTTTLFCRIRRYRGLSFGFDVKDKEVVYIPFQLKLGFKNITDTEGNTMYLVIQAAPVTSVFKTPHERMETVPSFTMRHSSKGKLEHVDFAAVAYLGYLPQDLINKDMVHLYHPDDLHYLQHVHEYIVRKGNVPRSKTYRMLTHNAYYLQVETEWTSFINPWSKKLEFVIGKHYIIEGPANPDVFQAPTIENVMMSEQIRDEVEMARQTILRIMNEIPTKPAEIAKMQMTKRCQEIATFMESLIDESPRAKEDTRPEAPEPEHSYFYNVLQERDSVMLGGISPHHDYTDSKSSTETTMSYNQLNYDDNLKRYFDSHESCNYYENYNNYRIGPDPDMDQPQCRLPMLTCNTMSSRNLPSTSVTPTMDLTCKDFLPLSHYHPMRLTESLLNKHNEDMEYNLLRKHREIRFTKLEREKRSNEKKNMKKEHLARCNAPFQPTTAGESSMPQPHGIKRSSRAPDDERGSHKHPRTRHRRRYNTGHNNSGDSNSAAPAWSSTPINNLRSFMPATIGEPQQISLHRPIPGTEIFPIYYMPAAGTSQNNYDVSNVNNQSHALGHQSQPYPYVIYGQPMYGPPMLYPLTSPLPYSMPHTQPPSHPQSHPTSPSPSLPHSLPPSPPTNYPLSRPHIIPTTNTHTHPPTLSQNLSPSLPYSLSNNVALNLPRIISHNHPPTGPHLLPHTHSNLRPECSATSIELPQRNYEEATRPLCSAHNYNRRSHNMVMEMSDPRSSSSSPKSSSKPKHSSRKSSKTINSENSKTDGESSSSFYSSFFKTDSAEDSGENKNSENTRDSRESKKKLTNSTNQTRDWPRRKIQPPWMEKVSVTSELIYNYQIVNKPLEEVLSLDKEKMSKFEQPDLVNEQLDQLYVDLQLEGVASRLTLEDGMTSSSSSADEGCSKTSKKARKSDYNKLVMIYEEDAPMPPPPPVSESQP